MRQKAGSSKKWVECGSFGRPWGVKGQISIFWNSGMCPVEVGRGVVYTCNQNGDYIPHIILNEQQKGRRTVVSLKGINTPEDAADFTNQQVYLPEGALPELPQGEYYCYQVLGLKVETENGEYLGKVVKIFPTGSNDVYEVKPPQGETILIPAIKDVVKKIDLDKKLMVIKLLKGLV